MLPRPKELYVGEQGWIGHAKPYVLDEFFHNLVCTRWLEISTRSVFGTNVPDE